MIRAFIVLCYVALLLAIAAPFHMVNAEVTESKKIHLLTTLKYVVKVQCANGSGSGVIINGKVLTAAHVVDGTYNCVIIDANGKMTNSTIEKSDVPNDLALLVPDEKLLVKGIRLSKRDLKKYDEVYTIGYPLGLDQILSKGHFQFNESHISFLNMNMFYGNSGGGVFIIEDREIRLVGIVHAITIYRNQAITYLSSCINRRTIINFLK